MIRYTKIINKKCCGGLPEEFMIPIGSTPYEIATITGMSITQAIELWNTQIGVNNDLCPVIYCNVLVSKTATKKCPSGQTSTTTITIPACRYSSQLSQKDADDKAIAELDSLVYDYQIDLSTCASVTCNPSCGYIVKSTKPCGEYRRNTVCIKGICIENDSVYFVCTGNCNGENCKEDCVKCNSACLTGACPDGFNCVAGSCVPICTTCSVDCPNSPCTNPCEQCVNGKCTPILCPTGKHCVNGECVDSPCNPECLYRLDTINSTACKEVRIIQECINGVCVDTIGKQEVCINNGLFCSDGKTCQECNCVSTCIGLGGGTCNDKVKCCGGLVCQNGTCKKRCDEGYTSINGVCVKSVKVNVGNVCSDLICSLGTCGSFYISSGATWFDLGLTILPSVGDTIKVTVDNYTLPLLPITTKITSITTGNMLVLNPLNNVSLGCSLYYWKTKIEFLSGALNGTVLNLNT